MFYRTLEAVHFSLVAESFEVTFVNIDVISQWALEAIGFMSNKGIIGGVDENMVAPQSNVTREQAIASVIRTYEMFKDVSIVEIEEEPVEEEVVEGELDSAETEGEPADGGPAGDGTGEDEPGKEEPVDDEATEDDTEE